MQDTARHRRPRLCFVAHYAYGAISGGRSGFIGGIEWQQSLMARWFAARGYAVTMLTWNEGQPSEILLDGVRVLSLCRRSDGIPGLRFIHPRWTSLNRAMRRADADLYYQNCGEYVTGQVALWCRRHGRQFVYSVASDPDCDPRLPAMHTRRERVLYRVGLRRADHIIVQTRVQQQMLRNGFSLPSTVIGMPCPDPWNGEDRLPSSPIPPPKTVGWVGRIVELKRLDWLLDIAATMPDVHFHVAGAAQPATTYSRTVEGRARAMSNVTLHGHVSRDRMPAFYSRIACLCCTSAYEGFPNTFLEAWSHGLPLVSTVDPDGLIAEQKLGCVADTVPALAAGLRAMLDDAEEYHQTARNARRYFVTSHTVERVMPQFEDIFLRMCRAAMVPQVNGV